MAASSQSAPPAPASSSTSTTSAAAIASAVHDPQWRLPGQHHRSYLLSTDEECGGSDFSLNPTVPITKYYQVSRRAYHQFRDSVAHRNENNVDEIYLMGNRLIKFISSVLPQHSQYGSNHEDLVEARDEVKLVLVEAGRLLSEVALYIDRLEWARVREEQEQEEEEEEELDEVDHDEDDAAWEADFAAFGTSSPAATSPHRLHKEITPILYSKSSTPRRRKNKGLNQRKVSFSPDVKPGKDDTLLTIVDLSSDTSTSIDLSIDRGVDDGHNDHDDDEPECINSSSTLDLSSSVSSSSSASPSRSTSLDDSEIDLEDEHRTFLQMTRMEFCSSSSFDAGADDDDGKDSVENEDDVDISIDEDQVVAAATSGTSSPTKQEHLDQTERALAELTEATQALSVRVRRYETEEVDDAPTDEEHTDVEDNGDKDEDEEDEFAAAPLNDVSGSSILADSDDDDDDSNEEDDDDDRLSFIQRVALENFTNDFNKTTIQAGADDDDSDAVDSWAQDGDGDGDDDFDTTTNSESGENGDFGGDGFLHSELGFDGPLPTFPSDGHDPFLLDKDAPWPDDADASPLGETFDFSAHGFGFGNNANNAGKHDSKPSSGILGASKRTLSKDDLLAGSASGTDADETAPTLPSSSGSYEFHGEVMSIGSAAAASASVRDDSVPDRLDYLESKLQALQHSRSGVLVEMMEGDRCPSPTIVGEDEVEV